MSHHDICSFCGAKGHRPENCPWRQSSAAVMTLPDLYLPLHRRWFEEIKAGTKTEEYREVNPYWMRRLAGRTFRNVILTLGYPKRHDTERRMVLPWRGYTVKTIEHTQWAGRKVSVFAIRLTDEVK